jgi:hypothetical protein
VWLGWVIAHIMEHIYSTMAVDNDSRLLIFLLHLTKYTQECWQDLPVLETVNAWMALNTEHGYV